MKSCDRTDDLESPSIEDTDLSIGFERPGQYSYRIAMRGRGEGRMAWDATELPESDRRVVFHYELDSTVIDTTVTGSAGQISDELCATAARPFLRAVFYPSMSPVAEETDLTVGDRIAVPMDGGTGTVEITDTPSRGSMECYTSVWRYDGDVRYRDCVAPERGLVLYATAYTTGSTDPLLTVELLEDSSAP